MQYASFDISSPLRFISCGKLVSGNQWTHPRRIIDSYVLLLGLEGTVHIQQGPERCTLHPGSTMLLLPETEHFGYEVDEDVSYYWCHFYCEKGHVLHPSLESIPAEVRSFDATAVLPVCVQEIQSENSKVLFRQLLHSSGRKTAGQFQAHYLLTSLALEISGQAMAADSSRVHIGREIFAFDEVLEWIRINLHRDFTLETISRHFHYNSEYFSRIFHKYTGQTLTQYLIEKRMEKARDFLLNTRLSVKEVAWSVGFTDEKHFMKSFKNHEGLTPTMFRNTVSFTHLNCH